MIIAPEWPPKVRLKRREAIPLLGLDDLDLEYQKRSIDSVSGTVDCTELDRVRIEMDSSEVRSYPVVKSSSGVEPCLPTALYWSTGKVDVEAREGDF